MPIDRSEFNAGETRHPVQRQIEEFLNEHPTMAYTAEEVAIAIGHPAGDVLPGSNELISAGHLVQRLAFVSELDVMALEGKIERRVVRSSVGHVTHYAAKTVP